MLIQNQTGNFIVTRDGELDGEYYDRIWQERKREVMQMAIHRALSVPKIVGGNLLNLLSEAVENSKPELIHKQ